MTKPQLRAFLTAIFMVVCLLAIKAFAADQPPGHSLHFTILHTNDLHSHDEPFVDRGKTVGGLARIAHIIRAIKAKDPNVLAIDAGDIFQGTPFFKFYHGEVEVQLLNDAGYDIYTIGNHEFDDGAVNLAEQLKKAHFDVISANIDATAVPALAALIKPSVVKTIDGQKVGFVGAIVPDLNKMALNTGGIKIKSIGDQWMDPIKQEVKRLKDDGIDKIILVTHCGLDLDKQLAEMPEVDAIVGGHSHTRLDKPIIVTHSDGSHCIIVQTGSYGRALGKLDLSFYPDGKLNVEQTSDHLINITDRIHDEKDITAYLKEKGKPFEKMRTTVVAQAPAEFDNSFRRYPWDSGLGDLVADSLAAGGSKYGATIAFQNRGGIRARIETGPITEETIDELLPFNNHLVVATLKGDLLMNVLENSVASDSYGGKFLDVHGIKFAYDHAKPPFHRVLWALTPDKDGVWKSVDPQESYRIAINDYSFHGGEGYDFSKATDVKETPDRLSLFFHDYVEHQKTVSPIPPSRIVPINSSLAFVDSNPKSHRFELVIKSNSAGARVYVVNGSGRDIATWTGSQVPVPMKQPKLISSSVIKDGVHDLHVPLPKTTAGHEHTEYSVVVVPTKRSDVAQISDALEMK